MANFWNKLSKPFFCLAPMDQVTDCAFREMVALCSSYPSHIKTSPALRAPSPSFGEGYNEFVLFTEFVSVDGLLHPDGKKRLLRDLKYTQKQRPIVAQVWGSDPEKFYKAAQIIKKLKFDGMDINMGCPQSKEISLGGGAALIKRPKLAQSIIKAAKKGAGRMPVSVKTRIGYEKNIIKDWIKALLKCEPAAITIHGRTKKEMSKLPAHWDAIADAVKIRNRMRSKTLIIGNGDVQDYQDGLTKARASGVDGIMIGRGSFGNPWIFRPENYQSSPEEKLRALLKHAQIFEKWYKGKKTFETMRKHFKAYAGGFEGAKDLRIKLMQTKSAAETAVLVKKFLSRDPFPP